MGSGLAHRGQVHRGPSTQGVGIQRAGYTGARVHREWAHRGRGTQGPGYIGAEAAQGWPHPRKQQAWKGAPASSTSWGARSAALWNPIGSQAVAGSSLGSWGLGTRQATCPEASQSPEGTRYLVPGVKGQKQGLEVLVCECFCSALFGQSCTEVSQRSLSFLRGGLGLSPESEPLGTPGRKGGPGQRRGAAPGDVTEPHPFTQTCQPAPVPEPPRRRRRWNWGDPSVPFDQVCCSCWNDSHLGLHEISHGSRH